ncbi:hypothetical protein [Anaerovibrio slackiae]|uniref:hypothetical protein n=1 Tax=Anaerovibrio slackiae TaxID=2652309 RepID=UPI003864168B
MSYKKFTACLIMAFLFAVMIFQPLLFLMNFGGLTQREKYLDEWIDYKKAVSSAIESPKIVLLSGSNTLFGIDAESMEQDLGIPVVNMGLHAGLGEYIFAVCKPLLQPGDVVILPLEYEYYQLKGLSGEGLAYVTNYDTAYFRGLPYSEQLKLLYNYDCRDMGLALFDRLRNKKSEESATYSVKNFDIRGDIRSNAVEGSKMQPPSHYKQVFSEDSVPNEKSAGTIGDFVDWCHLHDVKVYAAWPSYLCYGGEFNEKDKVQNEHIESFWRSKDVEVIGNFADNLYPAELFFDTEYHLNDAGRKIRTLRLLEDLKSIQSFQSYLIQMNAVR